MLILLVEDDELIGDGIRCGLSRMGMKVDWFRSGREGEAALPYAPYDAVILDLGLPEIDGSEILARWRGKGLTTPVLILTARDALPDRLSALNGGADDYLTKPFSLDEVAARLNALVRRSCGYARATIDYGALSLNTVERRVSLRGKDLDLSAREYALLELLLLNRRRILTRAQIEDKLYGWSEEIESNAVEVYIHRLRRKIGSKFIVTKRGLGYCLGEEP